MGSSVKFVLAIIDSASKKMGLKYKVSTGLLRGGRGGRGVAGPLNSKTTEKVTPPPSPPLIFVIIFLYLEKTS